MIKVSKTQNIADILDAYPQVAPLLMEEGMHCITCFASQLETLEEACQVHGLDPEQIELDINEYLNLESSL